MLEGSIKVKVTKTLMEHKESSKSPSKTRGTTERPNHQNRSPREKQTKFEKQGVTPLLHPTLIFHSEWQAI